MAMVVQHNIQAQLALGELNKNVSKVGKLLGKVSSGQKIVSAQDDSSAYVISEKMREQIRTLLQDNQNVQNGSALFKIADGGINSIVEELRNLKELAINSANDTNTDVDRMTIQKEFKQKMANINDIATTTNYNGKTLLDGTYRRKIFEVVNPDPIMIYDDGYNIDSDGVYMLAKGFTGTVNVNAQNVKIMQEDSSVALNNVYIIAPENGNANLWIEDLNIENQIEGKSKENGHTVNLTDENVIKFRGANNVLTVKGDNSLSVLSNDSFQCYRVAATINIGGGLTVKGESDSSLNIVNQADGYSDHGGAGIGSDFGENDNTGNISIGGNLTLTLNTELGAGIGGGHYGGTVGDISIGENATIILKGGNKMRGVGIGAGKWMGGAAGNITIAGNAKIEALKSYLTAIGSGDSNSMIGDITIGGNASINIVNYAGGAGIGGGFGSITGTSSAGDIKIGNNASVTVTVESTINVGACIGSGNDGSYVGDITIGGNATINVKNNGTGAGIGSGNGGSSAGDITINNAATVNATSASADDIGAGAGGSTVGTISYVDGLDISVPDIYIPEVKEPQNIEIRRDLNPLKIHHGTKANQATNFFINDMHTKSLGTEKLLDADGNILNSNDLERYDALSYDDDLQSAWLDTLKLAQNKTLDDISVTTQKNSNVAIRVLDGALEYALNEATQIGSYLQRLEYTDVNITTMGENVQASESTIRDADMAKEMTEYTKWNVLTQSAQAMLAQANQNSSALLSLLQ